MEYKHSNERAQIEETRENKKKQNKKKRIGPHSGPKNIFLCNFKGIK
jgi:hypothetical protein